MKAKGDAPGVRGVGFGLRTGEGGMAARSEEEEEEEDDDDDDACASPFCFFSGDSATGGHDELAELSARTCGQTMGQTGWADGTGSRTGVQRGQPRQADRTGGQRVWAAQGRVLSSVLRSGGGREGGPVLIQV